MSDKIYRRIIWFGIALVLIFSPLAGGATRVWAIAPVLLIEFTLVFLWLWRINNRGEKPERTALDKPIFAFVVLAVISFVFSIYKHDSFFALLRLFGYVGIFYLVLNNFDQIMRRRLSGLVIFIGAGLSLYGFLQYFGPLNHSWWNPPQFLAASYINHNHFAGYLELVIPVTIGMLFSRSLKSAGYRLVILVALIIMLMVFIFVQSRGGWLSLAVALLVMNIVLIKQGRLKKKSFFAFFIILGLIFSFFYFNRDEVSQRIETVADIRDLSFQTRLRIWDGAVKMARDNPLIGVGIGALDYAFSQYRPEGFDARAVNAHNEYLNVASEMGIAASLLMLWIFIAVIIEGLKKRHFNSRRLGCAIGILSLCLHGLIDFNFHIPANMLLFTIYAAFIMTPSKGDINSV
ncbi:MAG: O-antigen ligase family protein [Candidatus Omnitrophota bacterium]|jgi:O-antigen ligase